MSVPLSPGVFVVASPKVAENPHFARKVVLVLRHSADKGTSGVVINWPLSQGHAAELMHLAGGLEHLQTPDSRLFFDGGPIEPKMLVILHRAGHLVGGTPFFEDVHAGGNLEALRAHATSMDPQRPLLRLYLGYASWSPGQLEKEIAGGFWSLSPGSADLVFSNTPELVWQQLSPPQAEN